LASAGYSRGRIARWKQALAPHARPLPERRGPGALLVVDMQRYFSSICEPIVPAVRRVVDACRRRGTPVLFTQHGHADAASDGGMLAEWWDELIGEGTEAHQLLAEIGLRPGDPVIAKRRYSAFHDTELGHLLRDRGIEELSVAGVMTNLCVETTVREAFVRDFRVRVLMDATATATEELHLASLVSMAYGFAHVQTVEEWIASG